MTRKQYLVTKSPITLKRVIALCERLWINLYQLCTAVCYSAKEPNHLEAGYVLTWKYLFSCIFLHLLIQSFYLTHIWHFLDQYRDLRIHTLCDIKVNMAYFSRCTRDIIELGMNKILIAVSPIPLKSNSTRVDEGGKSRNIFAMEIQHTNRSGEGVIPR